MSNEKRYTAKQAAEAVLKRASELAIKAKPTIGQSGLFKVEYQKLEKAESGVHGSHSKQFPKSGTSQAGLEVRTANISSNPEAKEHFMSEAKKMHTGKLAQMKGMSKPNLTRSENPDEKQDAQLGEDVEHLCEDHMIANKDAEKKEGHKLVAKSECMKCMAKSAKMKKVLGGVGSPSTPVGRPDMGSGAIIVKGEDADMEKGDWNKIHDKLEREGYSKKTADKIDGSIKAKLGKAEKDETMAGDKKAPSNSMKPRIKEKDQEEPSDSAFEVKGKDSKSSDDPRQAHQPAPDNNPKEQAEGNNAQAGDTPTIADHSADGDTTKGHLKLAKFIGRMEFKRSTKKGVV